MKKVFIYLLLLNISLVSRGQSFSDSLRHEYDEATTMYNKGQIIYNHAQTLKGSYTDKLKVLSEQLSYFTKNKDKIGIAYTQLSISDLSSTLGDLSLTLRYGLSALKEFEQAEDTFGLLKAYIFIANSFSGSQNMEQGLEYLKKCLPIAKKYNSEAYATILNNTTDCLNNMNRPDSALPYIQEAVRIGYKLKDTTTLSAFLGTLAETYTAKEDYKKAMPFLQQSISLARAKNDYQILSYDLNNMAEIFFETSVYDSSLRYVHEALSFAYPDYLIVSQKSYELIYKIFDNENKKDSSNKYFRLAIEIKESILSDEKSKNIQILHFQEQIRQQEIEAQKEEIAQQHKQNIESVLIGIGIICFTIFFLLISRSFTIHEKLIKFLGIIALLLVFEFINLLVHSYIEELTHHSQILMLLLLVLLAALLIPLHHKMEHWTVHKLIEKNNQLRINASKKSVKKPEPDVEDIKE